MSLRKMCRKIIIEEILQDLKKKDEWKVLVLDDMALKIVSFCCTTEEILQENIAIIEVAKTKRSALNQYEAIYILEDTDESFNILNEDFAPSKCLYDGMHVYFLTALPNKRFDKVCDAPFVDLIKTIKEINIHFLPVESQVFSLDNETALPRFYCGNDDTMYKYCDDMAERVATLCCTLEEYPIIRFSRRCLRTGHMANAIYEKLQVYYKTFKEQMSIGTTQLLILDRGFDLTSTMIHELTLQAIAYDVMNIQDNVFKYRSEGSHEDKEMSLDETDQFWSENRHKHLAQLPGIMEDVLNTVMDPNKQPKGEEETSGLQRLADDVEEIIKLRLKKKYTGFRHMISECLECFTSRLKQSCSLEQDMATGRTVQENLVGDPSEIVITLLAVDTLPANEKLRLIILYIIFMNGIPEGLLLQLITTAKLRSEEIKTIKALAALGCGVIANEDFEPTTSSTVPRKDRSRQITYKLSRWTPILKDIIELLINDELDEYDFPCLSKESSEFRRKREPRWRRQEASENRSRIIIFVIGGLTYSEIRCAYEVTNENAEWEVIVGSDHIITPNSFIKDLQKLAEIAK